MAVASAPARVVRRALALGALAGAVATGACAPAPRDAAGDSTRAVAATTSSPPPAADSALVSRPDTATAKPPAAPAAAPAPPASRPATSAPVRDAVGGLTVTLERRPCHGTCPVYRVSVRELRDGRAVVRWVGERNVARTGVATDTVGREAVAVIAAAVTRADYFALPARYAFREPSCPTYAADAPVVATTVRRGARAHAVEHDYGCAAAPESLTALESAIDSAAGTSRWIGQR
ncbi:MAG TPA: DUF6438 domain-containing protein [Gemmatimonadaceae bacterium]|nr:DUF6438 domain-containing protein [Gemmatimonadaceae bacterium]